MSMANYPTPRAGKTQPLAGLVQSLTTGSPTTGLGAPADHMNAGSLVPIRAEEVKNIVPKKTDKDDLELPSGRAQQWLNLALSLFGVVSAAGLLIQRDWPWVVVTFFALVWLSCVLFLLWKLKRPLYDAIADRLLQPEKTLRAAAAAITQSRLSLGIALLIAIALPVTSLLVTLLPGGGRPAILPNTAAPCSTAAHYDDGVTFYSGADYTGDCASVGTMKDFFPVGSVQAPRSVRVRPLNRYVVVLTAPNGPPDYFFADTSATDNPLASSSGASINIYMRCDSNSVDPYQGEAKNGLVLFTRNAEGSWGCITVTRDVPDLAKLYFDNRASEAQLVGSFIGMYRVELFQDPNYKSPCPAVAVAGTRVDLGSCDGHVSSIRLVSATP